MIFLIFEKSFSWLHGLHFQTVYCHYRPDQRGNFNRSWKIQLPFQAPWTQNWYFGTLNSKLKQIGKIQNIYFCAKIERNMVGSRRWIGRNKRQIWYWKYPSRPQQPAFSKSPSQINVRRKFLSNSNPFTDKRIIVSGFQQIHNYIMQLYQCRGRSNSKVKTSFQKTTFLSEDYTFKRIIQSLCGLFKWHGHIWTCKREFWDASL